MSEQNVEPNSANVGGSDDKDVNNIRQMARKLARQAASLSVRRDDAGRMPIDAEPYRQRNIGASTLSGNADLGAVKALDGVRDGRQVVPINIEFSGRQGYNEYEKEPAGARMSPATSSGLVAGRYAADNRQVTGQRYPTEFQSRENIPVSVHYTKAVNERNGDQPYNIYAKPSKPTKRADYENKSYAGADHQM